MKQIFLSFVCAVLSLALSLMCAPPCAGAEFAAELDCRSAVLMEATTGRILYEKNADEPLPPASVTKIMTLLLICEAVDNGTVALSDKVPVSEYAASMGGSQVFLKVGEDITVEDMLKSITVASANDCAVAMAELIAGDEGAFVARMNERAAQLGMVNTTFKNATGLDDTDEGHLTSARDIAIMSAELLSHPVILNYSTIWMDTIRNGQFGLTNTNRLIRFYSGANGLKTGSTSKARFCISATAKRDDMQLIAVIMASPTRDTRNECAKLLLDYGFANYGIKKYEPAALSPLAVKGADTDEVNISYGEFSALLPRDKVKNVTYEIHLPQYIPAPIEKGQVVGDITYMLDGEILERVNITADEDVKKITFGRMFLNILQNFMLK